MVDWPYLVLPINHNYELDNGLVASVGFQCTLIREQVNGIEPSSSAWKADALTVVLHLHGQVPGFTPTFYNLIIHQFTSRALLAEVYTNYSIDF